MSKKNLKKFAAITLAATMAFGSTIMVFAEGEEDTQPTSAAGVSEGKGLYEGGEMKYPTLKVTLPTIPAGTYEYIADPNGLIEATDEAKYTGYTFEGNGIFFLTDGTAKKYTGKSAAATLTNENAQDIDVTVKLEQKTAGDAIIKYADSSTFGDDDKENKLYLAITDDKDTDPNVAALTSTGAAVVKATVQGVSGNYKAGFENNKYQYVLKEESERSAWNTCSFKLTGAINKNATWGDNITFPTIKVTWSYKEHTDSALSATTISQSANTLVVTDATVTGVKLVKVNGSEVACTPGTHYTFSNGKLSVSASMLGGNVGGKLKVTLSTGVTEEVAIQ